MKKQNFAFCKNGLINEVKCSMQLSSYVWSSVVEDYLELPHVRFVVVPCFRSIHVQRRTVFTLVSNTLILVEIKIVLIFQNLFNVAKLPRGLLYSLL